MSTLDILCSLTSRNRNFCRNLLRKVIGDKKATSTRITLTDPMRVFQLNIRPLPVDTTPSMLPTKDEGVLQLHGIHMELVDGTSFATMHTVRDHITDRFLDRLSQSLDEIHGLVTQLAQDGELPTRYRQMGEVAEVTLNRAVSAAQACQNLIAGELADQPGQSVPTDASTALQQAAEVFERHPGMTDAGPVLVEQVEEAVTEK
jgi:hypothetical protein